MGLIQCNKLCYMILIIIILVLKTNETSEIEKSTKEILRHQQIHRPLFIDRKLTMQDVKSTIEQVSLDNNHQRLSIIYEKPSDNLNDYDNDLKPQIRHSRSRGHLIRSSKNLDDTTESIDSYLDTTTIKINNKHNFNVKLQNNDEQFNKKKIKINDKLFIDDNIEPFYLKVGGSTARVGSSVGGSNINETMYLDIEDSILGNFTSNVSSSREYLQLKTPERIIDELKPRKLTSKLFNKDHTDDNVKVIPSTNIIDVFKKNQNHSKFNSNDYEIVDDNNEEMKNSTFDLNKNEIDDDDDDDFLDNLVTIDSTKRPDKQSVEGDIVTRFLRIIENQHLLGENCTAGTDLNLGEGVVDQYAQERFRLEAIFAVNRANMLTRLWKYAPEVVQSSEYLLHALVLSMVEFDEDIFAAGNCYDKMQYRDRWLYCPFAHRLQDNDGVLVKDLASEYKYLSNSSEWFYIARKNAERVIANNNQFSHGYHSYTLNETNLTDRIEDEILTVKYEDGRWSKPYYDCGGGNIWMLTYTVPFFGYVNNTYFFKGTSGIDIDLRRVDIDQCPLPPGSTQLNIFAASDKCKKRTTECVAIPGLGFRRGSYRCVCKRGFYFPDTKSTERYYNGTVIEEEFEKLMLGELSQYSEDGIFECLPCAEGCESCEDGSPCVLENNWLLRTIFLLAECVVIACLPGVAFFTWKYGDVKVVKAASPVLLRVIVLGAFFIYCTTLVMYPHPNVITCTMRIWLREIGFSLTYGALMLKTWRISVIFRVKSAKAVKITDMNLLKRLGIIVMIFSAFLGIRTIVAPPVVIVARTADDLKAYLCPTDWWDHTATILEVMFLVWGIRLCIVVRKAPSEFNESRFISMAIYNEFLLSVFLNVSMLFLQSPANPDLLYIIFFCHTQLTVTPLLGLIFGSKAYVVFRGGGKEDAIGKLPGATGKFIGKTCRAQATSNQTNSISLQQANFTEEGDGVTEEFRRLYAQLELLKEKNMRLGNRHLAYKITAMQEAANRNESTQVSTIQEISSNYKINDINNKLNDLDKINKNNKLKVNAQIEINDRTNNKNLNFNINKITNIDDNVDDNCDVNNSGDEIEILSSNDNETEIINNENKNVNKMELDVNLPQQQQQQQQLNSENNVGISTSNEIKLKDNKERNKNKSSHVHSHTIVINLDDKSRFSEEVTV